MAVDTQTCIVLCFDCSNMVMIRFAPPGDTLRRLGIVGEAATAKLSAILPTTCRACAKTQESTPGHGSFLNVSPDILAGSIVLKAAGALAGDHSNSVVRSDGSIPTFDRRNIMKHVGAHDRIYGVDKKLVMEGCVDTEKFILPYLPGGFFW